MPSLQKSGEKQWGLKIHRISMKKQCTEACWHVTEVSLLKWFLWEEVQSKREGMCVYLPDSVYCIAENNQINQKWFIEKWIFNKKKPCTYKILQDYECSNNNGQSLFIPLNAIIIWFNLYRIFVDLELFILSKINYYFSWGNLKLKLSALL